MTSDASARYNIIYILILSTGDSVLTIKTRKERCASFRVTGYHITKNTWFIYEFITVTKYSCESDNEDAVRVNARLSYHIKQT